MENAANTGKFSTLIQSLETLKSMGYTLEFTVQDDKMINSENKTELSSDDVTIDEIYHFEGESSPNDRSTLYAISASEEVKGTLVNGKGSAADVDVVAFLTKLGINEGADEPETDKTALAETDTFQSAETDTAEPDKTDQSKPDEMDESESVKNGESEAAKTGKSEVDKAESSEIAPSKPPESEVPMPPKNITTDTKEDTDSITTYNPDEKAKNDKDATQPNDEATDTTSLVSTNLRPEGEREINAPYLQMDLDKFIHQIKDESTWADSKHNSITIFKSDHMRLVLMGFHENGGLKEHSTKGIINLQVLKGEIDFSVQGEAVPLQQGQMIALHENIKHSLTAKTESFVLLTVVIG